MRIPWDRQETALLIDAYMRVKNRELSRKDAVKEISLILRRRAIDLGIEIDEIFRNENGISMQMKIIEGLIEERSTGLHSSTKLFAEMVELYKTNRLEYEKILLQAKGECVMQVNVQEEFFDWLSKRVSPAQLSEFYIVCKDIESFCLDKHILVAPLFETTNFEIIQGVSDVIKTNRMFQLKYFYQLGKMQKVIAFYMDFLHESPIRQNDVRCPKDILFNEKKCVEEVDAHAIVGQFCTVSAKNNENEIEMNHQVELQSEDEEQTYVVTNNCSETVNEDIFEWNFSDRDIDFIKINPKAVCYFGEKKKVGGWCEAFNQIIELLMEDYPAIVRGMVGYRFGSIGKVALSEQAGIKKLNKVFSLNNGLFLENDFTPCEMVSIIRILLNKCNIDYENIILNYLIIDEENVDSFNQKSNGIIDFETTTSKKCDHIKNVLTNENDKEEFENWLTKKRGMATRSAKRCALAVERAGKYAKLFGILDNGFYYINNPDEVYQISQKLLNISLFAQLNEKKHNNYRIALDKYLDYCKEIKNRSNSYRCEREKEFATWLQFSRLMRNDKSWEMIILLRDIEKLCKINNVQCTRIVDIGTPSEVLRLLNILTKNDNFIKFNIQHKKQAHTSLVRYYEFCKQNPLTEKKLNDTEVIYKKTEDSKQKLSNMNHPVSKVLECGDVEQYKTILRENFEDGLRPSKAIDRNRFRIYYREKFGQETIEDDDQLICTLLKVGTLRNERIFVKDESEQKDLLEEINETIAETFNNGASCIYLDCVYTKFQEALAKILHIYSVDALESVLFSSEKRNYFKRYNYLFASNRDPAPQKDVIEYMKKAHLPVSYNEIESILWYIPLDNVKHILVTTPGIVNVASEAYLFAPNLPVSDREIQTVAELIHNELLQKSYISDVELMRLIEEYCPSIIMNTPDYPMWGRRNALAYLLRDKFSFRGAIISDKDREISMSEVFSDFCHRSERLTVDELRSFASELNTVIYWESVYNEMVRINQNEFVRCDQIRFDVEQTDEIMDKLISGVYVPLKDIDLFLHFPPIDVPWNSFVLESYTAHYSKKFKLLHVRYTATECCGAIVRRQSEITNYRTLIVDVLSKSSSWCTKEDALQLLVDQGYQQRKSYGDIEKVMQEARARKNALKK